MSIAPAKTEISDTYPNPSNAVARAGFAALYDWILDSIGSNSSAAPVTVASATTPSLDAVTTTRHVVISGTATITSFTVAIGKAFFVRASGAFTLTNNASIVTNTGADIVAASGDSFMIRATAANTVEVLFYQAAATAASGNLAGTVTYTATATLSSGDLGKQIIFSGSTAAQVLTFPAVASQNDGEGYWVTNQASVSVTIKGNASESIYVNNGNAVATAANTLVLTPGDSVLFTSNGSDRWNTFGFASGKQFPSSQGTNGYFKLPNGLIIQYGSGSTTANPTTVTLPTSYPNNHYLVIPTNYPQSGSLLAVAANATLTNFQVRTFTTSTGVYLNSNYAYISIGN